MYGRGWGGLGSPFPTGRSLKEKREREEKEEKDEKKNEQDWARNEEETLQLGLELGRVRFVI